MAESTMQTLDVNGLRMQVVIQGSGPLVLLCHGFPELWISWRAQLSALAAAGYRAVAPDMRGYGGPTAPEDPTGDGPDRIAFGLLRSNQGFLDNLVEPETLPAWLSPEDVAYYVAEFSRTGFRGGLNWY